MLLMLNENVEQVAQEPADLGNCFLEDPYPDPLKTLMKVLKHEQILLNPFQNALGVTTPTVDLYLEAGRVHQNTDPESSYLAYVYDVHLSKTKASSVDTKIGENGDSVAILVSLFQYLMTLTFKTKIFLLLQVVMVDFVLLCFAGCKNSLSSP